MTIRETIEFCFAYERNIRRAIYEHKNDRVNTVTGGGGRSRISDPTAVMGIRQAEEVKSVVVEYGSSVGGRQKTIRLYWPERWLAVITKTKEHFSGTKYEIIIKMRYDESAVRRDICRGLSIPPTRLTQMVNTIIDVATGAAQMLDIR